MSFAVMQERPISDDATYKIGVLLDSIERVLKKEQEQAQATADAKGERIIAFPGLPADLRWRVMVLGASVEDNNFWVRREDVDGARNYKLTEIETGVEVDGVEAREACENYFAMVSGAVR